MSLAPPVVVAPAVAPDELLSSVTALQTALRQARADAAGQEREGARLAQ